MMNLNWIFPLFILVSGIFLMLWATRFSRQIFNGQETSLLKYLMSSALYGLWVFLVSVGGILLIGSVYKGYGWTTGEIIQIAILGIGAGILAIAGSLWQFFLHTKFRESLYKSLKLKNKSK